MSVRNTCTMLSETDTTDWEVIGRHHFGPRGEASELDYYGRSL